MRSIKYLTLIILIISSACNANDDQQILKICIDNGNWRPFVYQEDGQVKGLHIDTTNEALNDSNMLFEFIPSPWKRCLKGAEKGVFDAIATASFRSEEHTSELQSHHDPV